MKCIVEPMFYVHSNMFPFSISHTLHFHIDSKKGKYQLIINQSDDCRTYIHGSY